MPWGFAGILNKNQVVVGMPVLNRENTRERNTVGLFANTIPLIINVDHDRTFDDLVEEVKQKLTEAYRHRRLPIGEIVKVVYAAYPESLHAAAGQSVTSHLRKLERDGRARRNDEQDALVADWARTDAGTA